MKGGKQGINMVENISASKLTVVAGCCCLYFGCVMVLGCGGDGPRSGGSWPVLTPNGDVIVFGAFKKGRVRTIATQEINGTNSKIVFKDGMATEPDVDPSGQFIAFIKEANGHAAVHIMDSDGQNVRRVTDSSLPEFFPRFSSSGKRLAFARQMNADPHFHSLQEVFIIDTDGTNELQLTDNQVRDTPLRFSQDENSVYVASQIVGSSPVIPFSARLSKINVKTGERIELLEDELPETMICDVSNDEKTILYVSHGKRKFDIELFCQSISGGDARQLTRLGTYISEARFGFYSDKATFLAEPNRDGKGIIYLIKISDGALEKIGPNSLEQ